jgi:hypothetical protein
MLFTETIFVHCDNHTKLSGQETFLVRFEVSTAVTMMIIIVWKMIIIKKHFLFVVMKMVLTVTSATGYLWNMEIIMSDSFS